MATLQEEEVWEDAPQPAAAQHPAPYAGGVAYAPAGEAAGYPPAFPRAHSPAHSIDSLASSSLHAAAQQQQQQLAPPLSPRSAARLGSEGIPAWWGQQEEQRRIGAGGQQASGGAAGLPWAPGGDPHAGLHTPPAARLPFAPHDMQKTSPERLETATHAGGSPATEGATVGSEGSSATGPYALGGHMGCVLLMVMLCSPRAGLLHCICHHSLSLS